MLSRQVFSILLAPAGILLATLLISGSHSSCGAADHEKIKETDTLVYKIQIMNVFPVGWGYRYTGVVKEKLKGHTSYLNDTLEIGMLVSSVSRELNIGDTRNMTFYNSHKKNLESYLPAINGTINNKNEILYITQVE